MSKIQPYGIIRPETEAPVPEKEGQPPVVVYASVGAFETQTRANQTEDVTADFSYQPHVAKKIRYGTKDIEV